MKCLVKATTYKLAADRGYKLAAVGVLLIRKKQKACVMLYLTITFSIHSENETVFVSNNGLGPALIKDIRLKSENNEYPGDAYDFIVKHESF